LICNKTIIEELLANEPALAHDELAWASETVVLSIFYNAQVTSAAARC